jgi:ABC-2 type transport system permease protein
MAYKKKTRGVWMLNPYFKFFQIAFQDNINYRVDFLIRLATGFLQSYATVAIWNVIITTKKGILTPEMMALTLMYMIFACMFNILIHAVPEAEITNRVRTGEIGRDLVYPVSLPVSLFFKSLGITCVTCLTRIVPTFLILTLIFKPAWNLNPVNIAVLIVGAILGYYIYFLINLLIDMISFWWIETFYFHYIKEAVITFASGVLVPLWFYPPQLYKVISWLPFQNIVYTPLGLYLGKIPLSDFIPLLGVNLFWIIVLNLLFYLVWTSGAKKLVVQGG